MGLRVGLDRCGKSRPHRDSIPGPSVGSRYTDYVTRYSEVHLTKHSQSRLSRIAAGALGLILRHGALQFKSKKPGRFVLLPAGLRK